MCGGEGGIFFVKSIFQIFQSPTIHFSSIVKSFSNPFLEPTSTKQFSHAHTPLTVHGPLFLEPASGLIDSAVNTVWFIINYFTLLGC